MTDEEIVRTEHLTKRFGNLTAVYNLNLQIRRGEIYGFLGPNGAGKTTTILLISGIARPDGGIVYLFGQSLSNYNHIALKRRIGVMTEHPYLYSHMTAWEYLSFFSDFYGVPDKEVRIAELLDSVNLFERRHSYLREFSRGMQQKIGLVRALLHDPELLLLDEPTSGLDPYGIKQVRDILLSERERGKAVFISSHVLSEVEHTADRVGVIVKGKLQIEDSVTNLIQRAQAENVVEIELHQPVPGLADQLQVLPFIRQVEEQGNKLTVHLPPAEDKDYRSDVFSAIASAGGAIVEMTVRKASLEDAFLTITEDGGMIRQREWDTNV